MSAHRIDAVLQAAAAEGLLPAGTQAAAQDNRPWPIVLLTALGAWLAALPLIGVVGLLFRDLIERSVGPYLIGVLVLAGALVVLRSRQVPLFVEQLAVPALLVGGGALGFGLYRDLPAQAASAVLCLVAIGVAMLIATAWLRVLLGALAALLLVFACMPTHWLGGRQLTRFWLAWHLCLALWLLAGWLQGRLNGGLSRWRFAAAIESVSAGWLLATLVGLAWWSGMTFMVGGSAGSGIIGELAREISPRDAMSWQTTSLQAASLLLALVAAFVAARRWPSLREPSNAGIALVLAVLAWFMPSLGGVLLALVCCVTSARWRLAASAALAAAWIVGAFYYQLSWPLATKALVLIVAGVVLAGLAWWASRKSDGRVDASEQPTGQPPTFASRAGIVLSALAVLTVANIGIWQKEDLIAHGQPVYVELAPVDPRSLMQGDFMRLNFRVPSEARTSREGLSDGRRLHVVARRDERGVATLLRIDEAIPVLPDELRFELTPKNGQWTLVTDAWFFKEGEAARFARAKYGEFRVDASGRALLVGLRDARLEPL